MFKKIFVLTVVMLFFAGYGFAADQGNPEKITFEFTGATCEMVIFKALPTGRSVNVPVTKSQGIEESDAMVCTTTYPLMEERLASYGNLTSDKGKRQFDKSQEKLLTAAGRELYNDLMKIKVGRMYAIFQAPVGYNSINIVPMEMTPKDEALIDLIRPLFEKAAKLDAASE